jgi:hypothetical protein
MRRAAPVRIDRELTMTSTKAARLTAVAFAPLAIAAIALVGAAPAVAATPAGHQQIVATAAASDNSLWNDGEPAGGTGIDPGPQTAPDIPGIPDQAGVDSSDLGLRAGGTGIDPGPSAPADTPSGPGLEDGGEPAGAV